MVIPKGDVPSSEGVGGVPVVDDAAKTAVDGEEEGTPTTLDLALAVAVAVVAVVAAVVRGGRARRWRGWAAKARAAHGARAARRKARVMTFNRICLIIYSGGGAALLFLGVVLKSTTTKGIDGGG